MFDILIWWLLSVIIGIGFMPLTSRLFSRFRDGGWIFSKSIGIFISGYVMWLLSVTKIMKFSSLNCILILVACILVNVVTAYYLYKKDGVKPSFSVKLIVIEEVIFLAVYLIWTYLVAFKPAAYGTEKFMDYAFMTSMMRADYMPPADPWYAGEAINYYYGGQYLAVYLTKVSGVSVGNAYNLMRNTIAAFAFAMPFSMVYQLVDRLQIHTKKSVNSKWCYTGGALAGLAVSFCGNMHYVIYGWLIPLIEKIIGKNLTENRYFFPDSTRYIGHNPEIKGEHTIHEYPSYSFVLGDLHAHMINIMFVLVVLGLALAWLLKMEKKDSGLKLKEALLQPEILLIGFFTGMFRFTNFWDFPIYFVAGGCVVFFMNIRLYRDSAKNFFITTLAQAAEVLLIGTIASIPFTMSFDAIASKIKLTHSHSAFYQLVILWGLPAVIVITFIIGCILTYRKNMRKKKKKEEKAGIISFFAKIAPEDLFIFLMGLCALGLILMPEVIYVEDIYTETAYRANTMFKLTYQGYILFGICMGYILVKGLLCRQKSIMGFSVVGIGCLVLTLGYVPNAINSWYGDVSNTENMKGVDASYFLTESFSSDHEAVDWLNENVSGQPVILEADGESYSESGRVSVATGLPTVQGWYVHEWLWRNDTAALNERRADIKKIYTSKDQAEVESLIEKYNISYIYIGTVETEKYTELNHTLLQSIGEVAYSNGTDTYIMKVQ